MTDRATEVALFRYALIREAAVPKLSKAERGRLVRDLAAGAHVGPGGIEVRVGRSTADEWIRAWRKGGFEASRPNELGVVDALHGPIIGTHKATTVATSLMYPPHSEGTLARNATRRRPVNRLGRSGSMRCGSTCPV